MTDSRIQAIRERHAAATEGPWTAVVHDYTTADIYSESPSIWAAEMSPVISVSPCGACIEREKKAAETEVRNPEWKWGRCTCPTQADFDFIAHARADIPLLLDQLEAAQSQAKEHAALMRETAELIDEEHTVMRGRGCWRCQRCGAETECADVDVVHTPDCIVTRLRDAAGDE